MALHGAVRSGADLDYATAVARYLAVAGIAAGSVRVYRVTLTTWAWLLAGVPAPTGAERRGAQPPPIPLAVIDDPDQLQRLAGLAAQRADGCDPDTFNRELAVLRAAITWWQQMGWITSDPTTGMHRRPAPPDQTRALTREQVAALWQLDVAVRDKTLWRLLYESAARANEVLCLNIEDLITADKRARTTAKGGATEWIHWQSGTARLLPRLIGARTSGPLFLTDRVARPGAATLDVDPTTGRARLSYRRAAETFAQATRELSGTTRGWTLHQLRHSALTHDAEAGTSTPMLLARSRHASIRSLERYARPGVDAVAHHVATQDPANRRRSPS